MASFLLLLFLKFACNVAKSLRLPDSVTVAGNLYDMIHDSTAKHLSKCFKLVIGKMQVCPQHVPIPSSFINIPSKKCVL